MTDFKGTSEIPQSILKNYIELYKIVGMGEANFKLLNSDYNYFNKEAISDDIFYLFKCFFKNSKVSDERIKQFSKKDNILTIHNKDEQMLKNIKHVFTLIYSLDNFELTAREITDLKNILSEGLFDRTNSFTRTNDNISKEKKLGSLCDKYMLLSKDNTNESLYLASSFLIEFMYLSPFTYLNELIGAIIYYLLILKSDLKAFKYSSYFKELYSNFDEYNEAIRKGYYLIDEGLINPNMLLKLLFRLTINSYHKIDELVEGLNFDKKLSKSSTVINVIYKLNDTFSKREIMDILPGVSMSTVDRALKELSDEGKIEAIGTGRSAKWIRLDHSKDEVDIFKD